jgi:hypothetical protein
MQDYRKIFATKKFALEDNPRSGHTRIEVHRNSITGLRGALFVNIFMNHKNKIKSWRAKFADRTGAEKSIQEGFFFAE